MNNLNLQKVYLFYGYYDKMININKEGQNYGTKKMCTLW